MPLALRITFPDASRHALRLTLQHWRLPHGEQQFAPDGSSVYLKVTGSQAAHCFWCYTSAHTCRPVAWLLPVKTGLCLRFRRNTQRVLRLILLTSGTDPLVQAGYTVELLPKLAFFTSPHRRTPRRRIPSTWCLTRQSQPTTQATLMTSVPWRWLNPLTKLLLMSPALRTSWPPRTSLSTCSMTRMRRRSQ